jgi:hypothetical protein
MTTTAFELVSASIVIVFDVIDRRQISRDLLREMISGESPSYVDMPGGPLLVYYEGLPGTNCVINDRRILLSQGAQTEPGKGNLAEMANVAKAAIGDATMIAYGVNFYVKGSIEGIDNIGEFFRDKLLRGLRELETGVGARISGMFPRLEYVIADARYQLRIDPDPDREAVYGAQLNIHHATESLPEPKDLALALDEGFAHLGQVLDKVFSIA